LIGQRPIPGRTLWTDLPASRAGFYAGPALLIVDEIGYVPITAGGVKRRL
jgi:hypothetical protein